MSNNIGFGSRYHTQFTSLKSILSIQVPYHNANYKNDLEPISYSTNIIQRIFKVLHENKFSLDETQFLLKELKPYLKSFGENVVQKIVDVLNIYPELNPLFIQELKLTIESLKKINSLINEELKVFYDGYNMPKNNSDKSADLFSSKYEIDFNEFIKNYYYLEIEPNSNIKEIKKLIENLQSYNKEHDRHENYLDINYKYFNDFLLNYLAVIDLNRITDFLSHYFTKFNLIQRLNATNFFNNNLKNIFKIYSKSVSNIAKKEQVVSEYINYQQELLKVNKSEIEIFKLDYKAKEKIIFSLNESGIISDKMKPSLNSLLGNDFTFKVEFNTNQNCVVDLLKRIIDKNAFSVHRRRLPVIFKGLLYYKKCGKYKEISRKSFERLLQDSSKLPYKTEKLLIKEFPDSI